MTFRVLAPSNFPILIDATDPLNAAKALVRHSLLQQNLSFNNFMLQDIYNNQARYSGKI